MRTRAKPGAALQCGFTWQDDAPAEASNPLADLQNVESAPAAFVASDDDLPEWLRENASCARKAE
jgi:hypothetical protein